MRKLTSIAIIVSCLATDVWATIVTMTCVPDGNGGLILTYTVTREASDSADIKDFHLYALEAESVAGTPQPVPGAGNTSWIGNKGGRWVHWQTNGPGITNPPAPPPGAPPPPPGSQSFRILVPNTTTCPTGLARWYATSTGERVQKPSNTIDTGPNTTSEPPVFLATVQAPLLVSNLTQSNVATIGQVTPFGIHTRPYLAGKPYILALAFGDTPGQQLTATVHLPLNPDPLFWLSFQPNPFMQGFMGVATQAGFSQAAVFVPPVPALQGEVLYISGVVLNPGALQPIAAVSDAEAIVLWN